MCSALDTSGYQVSAELDEVEIYWENDQLHLDAVFRPGSDTPFSSTAFDDLGTGGPAENEEEENENSPPPPTAPVSGGLTQPTTLLKSRLSGTRIENVPDYVYRNLFQ